MQQRRLTSTSPKAQSHSRCQRALRLHPPVTLVNREAQHDDVIPVSEPFVDAQGRLQHGVEVRRGNRIFVGIAAFQTSKEVWGADALEFKCVSMPRAAWVS